MSRQVKLVAGLVIAACLAVGMARAETEPAAAGTSFDVVVIEATPGGIATAVRAAREGLRVLLVNRTQHLGGILSSGLGVWDTLYEGHRAPIYDEVRQAIFDHYRMTYGEKSPQFRNAVPGKSGHTNGKFEPCVAEAVLTSLVERETNLSVLKGYVAVAVQRDGALLRSVTLREFDGIKTRQVAARIFADCSYEGDLLPLAKVAYRVGREARSEFNETHAGRIFMKPSAKAPTDGQAELGAAHDRLNLRKFPGFQEIVTPASTGESDGNVQAFNYRTILSSDPHNQMPVSKPASYDSEYLKTLEFGSIVSPLPNQKIGWNRPQLVGPHQAYIEGDWEVRRKVMDQHWQATMGLLYFLQNDPSVPAERRAFFGRYGLAKDEFTDNGHRPYEIYVREARRLVGRATITEHDLTLSKGQQRTPVQGDSIAFAEWYMDAHACTATKVEGSLDEGKMMLHHESFPAHIPYSALLPKDVDNLLVPVCLSATHVAWGAIRLEPAWMQIGESAGFACAQAVAAGTTPTAIDVAQLQYKLVIQRSMISFFNDIDVASDDPAVPAALFLATKGFFPTYDAALAQPLDAASAQAWRGKAKQLGIGLTETANTTRGKACTLLFSSIKKRYQTP